MKEIKTILFLLLLHGTMITRAQQPNIVLILVDDLGYGDVNLMLDDRRAFSNPNVLTPNLAKLARESLVMRHHYAAAPVCSPSRAGLLTGRTPTRSNINLYINDITDNDKHLLHGAEITVAEVLKSAGYQTAIFGKWHLNGADWEVPENWTGWTGSFPKQQGFDHGLVGKEDPHFTRQLKVNTQKHPGDYFTVDGIPLGPIKGYSSDIISSYACDWMEENSRAQQPFFAFLSYDAVHIRIAAADKFEALYHTGDARKDAYYANITHLDAAIGQVMRKLDALGISENTILIFSSDNGPDVLRAWEATYYCYGTSYPLTGQKYQLFEGGIRVPGMVRWPGKIKARISDTPNGTVDLLPTFCTLVDQPLPDDRAIDGASLMDYWLHDQPVERKTPLYWQFEHVRVYDKTIGESYERRIEGKSVDRKAKKKARIALRDGDHLLLGFGEQSFEAPTDFRLFNVVEDPEQKNDLAPAHPQLTQQMKVVAMAQHESVNKDRLLTKEAIRSKSTELRFEKP